MDEQKFWSIISMLDWDQTGDDTAVLEPAAEYLAEESDEDIAQFYEILSRLLYGIDGIAWAQHMSDAPVVDGDPYYSPDDFLNARCYVVADGEETYYEVLENPEQMPQNMGFEALLHLCDLAWEHKHGSDPDFEEFFHEAEYDYESFSNDEQW